MFVGDTVSVLIEPDGRYRLTAPLVYSGATDRFTVPAGFVTDLASVPRWATWLVPVSGHYSRAAIVHDWLCVCLEGHGTPLASAVDTDGILRRICRELGTPLARRWLIWAGVRWGALGTPARRGGWLGTLPLLLVVTLLASWLLPVLALALLGSLVDSAIEALTCRFAPAVDTVDSGVHT